MRKKIVLCLLFIVLLSFTGCNSTNTETSTKKVSASLSLSKNYETISMLKELAENVIEIEVISNETLMYDNEPYTKSKVKINDSLKGNLKSGEEVYIIESGGLYSQGDYSKEIVELTMEGVPVMKIGEKYILFIQKFQGPQTDNAHVILGVFQGKFKLDEKGKAIQTAPDFAKAKDYKKSLNKDEFKKLLK